MGNYYTTLKNKMYRNGETNKTPEFVNINHTTMLNMEMLDKNLHNLPVVKITSENLTKILLHDKRFYIDKNHPLDIAKEREKDPKFDSICKLSTINTNYDIHEDYIGKIIILSNIEWYATKNSEINIHHLICDNDEIFGINLNVK